MDKYPSHGVVFLMVSFAKRTLLPVGLFVAGWALNLHGQESTDSADSVQTPSAKSSSRDAPSTEEYLRITKDDDGKLDSMETAIVTFRGKSGTKYAGQQVDLVGVVHIGELDYYKDLNQRFESYDRVLYELVAPEGTVVDKKQAGEARGPLGAMQLGMKDVLNLEFQLEHIDYKAKNFRHADMSPEEFAKDMADRGDSVMQMIFRMLGSGLATQSAGNAQSSDAALLLALFAPDRSRRMKQIMASQFQDMEIATAAMADASGKSTIITERNAKAMSVLRDELDSGTKKVAVFYGAGHLPDMARRLDRDFEMKSVNSVWLQAWDLQKN